MLMWAFPRSCRPRAPTSPKPVRQLRHGAHARCRDCTPLPCTSAAFALIYACAEPALGATRRRGWDAGLVFPRAAAGPALLLPCRRVEPGHHPVGNRHRGGPAPRPAARTDGRGGTAGGCGPLPACRDYAVVWRAAALAWLAVALCATLLVPSALRTPNCRSERPDRRLPARRAGAAPHCRAGGGPPGVPCLVEDPPCMVLHVSGPVLAELSAARPYQIRQPTLPSKIITSRNRYP